jgi:hypothetical protein
MKVVNPIFNSSYAGNFFQIFIDFELIQGFRKTDLKELWPDRLIEILIPNSPELHFGQGLLHDDLQRLYYDLGDRYTLTPRIKEDIKF